MIATLLKLLDPMRAVAMHRSAQFKLAATCGRGLRATERACLFAHRAPRSAIRFGDHALIDGTVEVYTNGRLSVGRNFFLGRSRIYCAHAVTVGDHVLVSDNVSIMDSDLHPARASLRRDIADRWAKGEFPDVYRETPGAPVVIEDDVWIGFGASILKGVTIGRGAIVGAGALVTSNVQAWTVVAGTPARVIREIGPDER